MTTMRRGWFRAVTVAAMIGFTGWASAAHAQTAPTPAPEAESAPAPQSPSPAAPTASAAAAAPEPAQAPASASQRTLWPWVIMGTGVALIVTAAAFQVRAVSEDDKREADETKLFALPQGDPQRKELQDSAKEHDDSATSSRTTSLVLGTVGFLAVAGSVVLWFFEGSSNATSPPATARSKPTFTPSLAPGYAGAMLGARF